RRGQHVAHRIEHGVAERRGRVDVAGLRRTARGERLVFTASRDPKSTRCLRAPGARPGLAHLFRADYSQLHPLLTGATRLSAADLERRPGDVGVRHEEDGGVPAVLHAVDAPGWERRPDLLAELLARAVIEEEAPHLAVD